MDRFWGVGGAWHAEPRDWSQQARSTGRFCVETALRPAATPRSQGTSRDRSAGPAGACGQPPCPPLPTRQDPKRSGQAKTDRFGDLGLKLRSGSADPRHCSGPRGSGPWGRGSRTRPEHPPRSPPARLRGPPPNPRKMRPEALGHCTGAWGVGDGRGSTAPAC